MSETIKCSSGKEYQWRNPPRHVFWKHGRIANYHAQRVSEINAMDDAEREGAENMTEEGRVLAKERERQRDSEKFYRFMEGMTDEQRARFEEYTSDVIKAGTGMADISQISDGDFWELFTRAMRGNEQAKVETAEGETTVETVENFPAEPPLPAVQPDVPDVRRKTIAGVGAA